MRTIIQRVMKASVSVDDNVVSSIGRGVCVLVGISRTDSDKELEYMVRKVLNLRIFEDDSGKTWNKSVMDKDLEVLCVSQFTLYSILKGNKPDFHAAMGGEDSARLYEKFVTRIREEYQADKVKDGLFGAYMQVAIQNDGPVTITLEAPDNLPELKKRGEKAQQKKEKVALSKDKPVSTDNVTTDNDNNTDNPS